MFRGTSTPIIRSPRILYSGCCLWCFVLWFSSCWSGVELRVMCPVCRMLLCPSSGAQEYYTVVAACGISCCGFQVAGLVWSWGLCVRFAGCCYAHHQELKSIIQWLLPVVFLAMFFKLLVWCGAECYVSGLQDVAMPIIRSSRVLYSGCCLLYFVLWFSSCWSSVELRVMCPVCRMLLCPS